MRIVDRGATVVVIGADGDADLVSDLLHALLGAIRRGHTPSVNDVSLALHEARNGRAEEVPRLLTDRHAALRNDIHIRPRTRGQKTYLDAIKQNDITLAIGPAGTGKTYLAMAAAVSALLDKSVKRIVLTRPAVEAGESLGFLPGDLREKVNPYLRPLYDALYVMVDMERVQKLFDQERIEVAPLAYMRGRTLDYAYIVLDEAQNTTPEQMKMFLTRLGTGSRAVITGDITQTDLPRGVRSGLAQAMRVLQDVEGVGLIHLDRDDVVRHPLVQRIIDAYDAADQPAEPPAAITSSKLSSGNL